MSYQYITVSSFLYTKYDYRSTLNELSVHNCGILSVSNVLLCDNPHYTLGKTLALNFKY